jgi:hypothetical protein
MGEVSGTGVTLFGFQKRTGGMPVPLFQCVPTRAAVDEVEVFAKKKRANGDSRVSALFADFRITEL